MTDLSRLRVLFFDTFGTTVAQRGPVADELSRVAEQTLEADNSTISDAVRAKARAMTYEDWDELGNDWNKEEDTFVAESKKASGNVNWKAVDNHRIAALPKLLARKGLVSISKDGSIGEGSLWNESTVQHLGLVWHRLSPWPESCRGLDLLNEKFTTVALSNTYQALLEELVAHSKIPFKHVFSSELFESYKPNSKVYLGAAERLGVGPEECALVAAHLDDLKGAKACGFYAIYVQRHLEEKTPELEPENIPDLTVTQEEEGFVALAQRLGITGE